MRSRVLAALGCVLAAAVVAGGASAFGIDTDQPPPPGIVGTPYTFKFVLKAGAPPYEVHFKSGDLTPGLKIESDGTLHGTPTQAGTFEFTVEASQYCAPDPKCFTQWGFTQTVRDRLNITTPSLPAGTPGVSYTATLNVAGTGGKGMSWKVVSGSLPPGVSLAQDPAGGSSGGQTTISGTPTTAGTYTFTVKVGDTDGFMPDRSASKQFTITIAAQLVATSAASLPTGIQGKLYNATPASASGGVAPYTWSVASGALPTGLALDPATGAVQGRPSVFGTFPLTLAVRDASGQTANTGATITVVRALDLRTTRLRAASVGAKYSATLRTVGGQAPISYALSGGKLPAGLKLNKKTGVVSGTPKKAGPYRFRVTATDALAQRSSERIALLVRA